MIMIKIRGFTLLELLIVIIILGVLSAIAIPMYTKTIEQNKGESCAKNIQMIAAAEKMHRLKTGSYNCTSSPTFYPVNDINTALDLQISEKYFGKASYVNNYGYNICHDAAFNLIFQTFRQDGDYKTYRIRCKYDVATNEFDWFYNTDSSNWFNEFDAPLE